MKILGFYISRTDWEYLAKQWKRLYWSSDKNFSDIKKAIDCAVKKANETYTGEDGRLRFKHNGQFAPDNRSKFKQMHDRLRTEVNKNGHYDDAKNAGKS